MRSCRLATSQKIARDRGLDALVHFRQVDANKPLPFEDGSFDAVVCIESIHHLVDRLEVLRECHRVLRHGRRILYTDPFIITGILTLEDMTRRASLVTHFEFTPPGEDERLIREAGFELVRKDDVTDNVAEVSRRWHSSRSRHRDQLIAIDGEESFDSLQELLLVTNRLSVEGRLSRFVFMGRKMIA